MCGNGLPNIALFSNSTRTDVHNCGPTEQAGYWIGVKKERTMEMEDEIIVVRLGHRAGRDERLTTHVGLTARAFGADRVVLPEEASSTASTVEDVTDRFGGPFEVTLLSHPMSWVRSWEGPIAHLTMYGLPVDEVIQTIRASCTNGPLAIVVGGGKVAGELYELANWNVAVTTQPHSEVAALAVFLDRLHEGAELQRTWRTGNSVIVPTEAGKRVIPRDELENADE